MAIGLVLSLAIVTFPTINVSVPTFCSTKCLTLAASMSDLSKAVAEEVPGMLSSLKLSGLEIGELTQHLGNLRQRISRSHGQRGRGSKSSPFGRQKRNYTSGDTF